MVVAVPVKAFVSTDAAPPIVDDISTAIYSVANSVATPTTKVSAVSVANDAAAALTVTCASAAGIFATIVSSANVASGAAVDSATAHHR